MNILKPLLKELTTLTTIHGEYNVGQIEKSAEFNTKQFPLFLLNYNKIKWQLDASFMFAEDVELELRVVHNSVENLYATVDTVVTNLFEKKLSFSDRLQLVEQTDIKSEGRNRYIDLTYTIPFIRVLRADKNRGLVKPKNIKQKINV